MPTVLITGANRGLGLEFARQYAADGWQVIATARDPAKAKDLAALGVEVHALDVADFAQIAATADRLKDRAIDVVVNNAGVFGGKQRFGEVAPEDWAEVLAVNTIAPLMVAQAFVGHLARGQAKVFAAVTSRMGSIGDNTSGGYYAYRSSKAGLNAVVKSLAVDLAPQGIAVVVLHPGWVKTDMGGPGAPLSPPVSVAGMRARIAQLTLADSGRFLDHDGQDVPW